MWLHPVHLASLPFLQHKPGGSPSVLVVDQATSSRSIIGRRGAYVGVGVVTVGVVVGDEADVCEDSCVRVGVVVGDKVDVCEDSCVRVGVVAGDEADPHDACRVRNPLEPVNMSFLLAFESAHPSPQSA